MRTQIIAGLVSILVAATANAAEPVKPKSWKGEKEQICVNELLRMSYEEEKEARLVFALIPEWGTCTSVEFIKVAHRERSAKKPTGKCALAISA